MGMIPLIEYKDAVWAMDMECLLANEAPLRAYRLDSSQYAATYFNITHMTPHKSIGRIDSQALLRLKGSCKLHIDIEKQYDLVAFDIEPVIKKLSNKKKRKKKRSNKK